MGLAYNLNFLWAPVMDRVPVPGLTAWYLPSEVTPISKELADARGSIWTPGKEEGETAEKKLWIPGS